MKLKTQTIKKTIYQIIHNITGLFKKEYHILYDIKRPAFIKYADNGYSIIKNNFDGLIINFKKEVDSMDARELVIAQLDALNREKQDLVNAVLEAEKETIAEIKLKAAEAAEAEYKEEVEVKVAHQFKIAEEHLNKLLEALPVEQVVAEQPEVVNEELEETKEPII